MTPFMMQKSFDDFDDFAEQVRDWRLDFLQLEPGPFAAGGIPNLRCTHEPGDAPALAFT